MPEKETVRRARKKKREGKARTTQAGEFVREEMHHIGKGKHGAHSTKQALAIGLSKARRAGVKLKPLAPGETSERTRRGAERAYSKGQTGEARTPSWRKRRRGEQETKGAQELKKEDEGDGVEEEVEMAAEEAEMTAEVERPVAETLNGESNRPERSGDEQKNRRSRMAIAIEENIERAREDMERAKDDYKEMTKTWKDGYLQSLDACLQWQAENQRLIKDTVKQGLSGSRQFLTSWKDWIEGQAQRQAEIQRNVQRQAGNGRHATNVTNPFLGFTKQSTEAVLATVEPLLKNSEAAVESSFGYYENAVATPSRKYVREINQQVLDAVIPS